jgi:hypothetical protein
MKTKLIFLFSIISSFIFGQSTDFEFKVYDLNDSIIENLLTLNVDDSLIIQQDINDKFKVELIPGFHKISSKLYGNKIIDTTLFLNSENLIIKINANILPDRLLNEFNAGGFKKMFSKENSSTSIGLKEAGTFIMKSFFHVSIVGCMQFEKGKYTIQDNNLILDVDEYECPCFSTQDKIMHTYKFALKNNDIADLDKYYGFIVEKYLNIEPVEEIDPIVPLVKYDYDKLKFLK